MAAAVTSAGILLYRRTGDAVGGDGAGGADGAGGGAIEVFLAHMGGPFWAKKDAAAWSIPKGEYTTEDSLDAARREFCEEIGVDAPAADYALLGDFVQKSRKVVRVYVAEAVVTPASAPVEFVASNTFDLEWPPRSGRMQQFAEIDRAEWMTLAAAAERLVAGQRPALDALRALLGAD